jgi:hypothetical protein
MDIYIFKTLRLLPLMFPLWIFGCSASNLAPMIVSRPKDAYETEAHYQIRNFDVTISRNLNGLGSIFYQHTSTQRQRGQPELPLYQRAYEEPRGLPYLRSGDVGLDAIFALAMSEVRQASVESVTDNSFNYGNPISCSCFATGELWPYVWTRDASYSVDLGLHWLDPERSLKTLLFKISHDRQDSPLSRGTEVVQDTGTGGSWPISTDRVVWALGAHSLLDQLQGATHASFLRLAYEVLLHTLETDRKVIFNKKIGLYHGEQSFLDWREQSYPSWTKLDVKAIGESFALSTNILHLMAIRHATEYALKLGHLEQVTQFENWSHQLAIQIRKYFWKKDKDLFAAMTSATTPPFPLENYDLLGEALAVLAGLTTPDESQSLFSRYPIYSAGPPVIHPQQSHVPIYHNRAMWPFVTAYAIKAAAAAKHPTFVSAGMISLWEAAALNLSHMENLEVLTGLPWVDSGPLSGPIVNSKRQLWSIAGFVSLIIDTLFGLKIENNTLHLDPRITAEIAHRFGPLHQMTLYDLRWAGKKLNISMNWQSSSFQNDGFFEVKSITLNDKDITDKPIPYDALPEESHIEIQLRSSDQTPQASINRQDDTHRNPMNAENARRIFAPAEPRLSWVDAENIRIENHDFQHTNWTLYANDKLIAEDLTSPQVFVGDLKKTTVCFTAMQRDIDSKLASHPSPPLCHEGWQSTIWETEKNKDESRDFVKKRAAFIARYDDSWGYPDQVLEGPFFQVPWDGFYGADIFFNNTFGPINSGVTAAVKTMIIKDDLNEESAISYVWMPHVSSQDMWSWSSLATWNLKAGRRYQLILKDAKNMSYMAHYALYTGGAGGVDGITNRVRMRKIRLKCLDKCDDPS